MNVMKQYVIDTKGTTYEKYEWHTHRMQKNKTSPIKSKGFKKKLSPI